MQKHKQNDGFGIKYNTNFSFFKLVMQQLS